MSDFKAVQIFSPSKVGRYKLDRVALVEILTQDGVANKPVAIYSLAGAFRQGKSFMLNLFMRFLQHGRSDTWLRNKTDLLNKGFGWRGGRDRCTQGIWMWNEPFTVSTDDGEVVIFLMDTQGTFDHDSSMLECSLIFALSTLISSFQIFNLMRQIQENDFQHLQLFTEYGKITKRSTADEEKAFQRLMFLIRDWHDPDYEGLEGGREVLAEALKVRTNHRDLLSVRQNICDSFEQVDCELLPQPGRKVMRRSTNDNPLMLGDIDEEFLDEVNSLVRYLFIENIAVKRVNGNVVTGTDLINFTIAYCEVFESGNMPEIGTIMEASAKAAILTTIQKCKDEYKAMMNRECEGRYINESRLSEFHLKFRGETLQVFDELPKLGDKNFIRNNRGYLAKDIEKAFRMIAQYNDAHRENLKMKIRDIVEEAIEIFNSNLENGNQGYIDEQSLPRIERNSRNAATTFFRTSTKNYDGILIAEYTIKLYKMLREEYMKFDKINVIRKKEFERKLSDLRLQGVEKYKNAMNEKCSGRFLTNEEFLAAHCEAAKAALAEFDSSRLGCGTCERHNTRSKLQTETENVKMTFEKDNETNKKLDEAADILKGELRSKHKEDLEQFCRARKMLIRPAGSNRSDRNLQIDLNDLNALSIEHERLKRRALQQFQNQFNMFPEKVTSLDTDLDMSYISLKWQCSLCIII